MAVIRSRRPLALLAAAALAAGLAACGEKEEPETTPTDAATTTSSTTATRSTTTGQADAGGAAGGGGAQGGSGGGSEGPSGPQTAEGAVEAFLSGPDAKAVCEGALTEEFVKFAYGDAQGCLKGRDPSSLAKPTEPTSLKVTGAKATATITPSGGTYGGEKLTIRLVETGGSWRVDGVDSNVPVGP